MIVSLPEPPVSVSSPAPPLMNTGVDRLAVVTVSFRSPAAMLSRVTPGLGQSAVFAFREMQPLEPTPIVAPVSTNRKNTPVRTLTRVTVSRLASPGAAV